MSDASAMTRDWNNRAFSPRELHAIRKLSECFFDPEGEGAVSDRLDWLVDEIDRMAGATNAGTRVALRLGLIALQVLPLFFGFGLRSMGALPVPDRVRFLHALEGARWPVFGLPVFAWKTLLCASYFEHPDALAETGYDGACLVGEGSLTKGDRKPSRLPVLPPEGRAA